MDNGQIEIPAEIEANFKRLSEANGQIVQERKVLAAHEQANNAEAKALFFETLMRAGVTDPRGYNLVSTPQGGFAIVPAVRLVPPPASEVPGGAAEETAEEPAAEAAETVN
jgi:hypothetical protein